MVVALRHTKDCSPYTNNNNNNNKIKVLLLVKQLWSTRTVTMVVVVVVVATVLQRMSSTSSFVVSGWTIMKRARTWRSHDDMSLRFKSIDTVSKDSKVHASPLKCCIKDSRIPQKQSYNLNHHRWMGNVQTPRTTSQRVLFSTVDGTNHDGTDIQRNGGNTTTSVLVDDGAIKKSAVLEAHSPDENTTTISSTSANATTGNDAINIETSTTTTTTNSNVDTSNICGSSILAIDPADIVISIEPSWTPPDSVNGSNGTTSSSATATAATSTNQQQQQQPLVTPSQSDLLRRLPFVSMFRGSANYIANHRNTVAVYHIPGGLLCSQNHTSSTPTISETEMIFRDLMNDVALTWLLGIKIVIVVGCRHQIEQRLLEKQNRQQELMHLKNNNSSGILDDATKSAMEIPKNVSYEYDVVTSQHGLRVTSPEILRIVKEEAGYVRFEVERQLARSLRLQGGGTTAANAAAASNMPSMNGGGFIDTKGKLPPASMNGMSSNAFTATSTNSGANSAYFDGNVVSGNFYSAQPFGILDGVDYQYTGFVRRVEVEKIRQLHASRDICLLTTLGVSPSGEVFNVNSESLAAIVAGAMEASKVVYFTEQEVYLRHKVHGNKIQSLRLKDGLNFLNYYGIQMHSKGFVTMSNGAEEIERRKELTPAKMDMLLKIGWCTGAIGLGVKRAHIITPQYGALLQELYTRDGSGTLISADLYEGIRRATVLDVSSIHAIIAPLIAAGTLIDRPKAQLEKDVDQYYIYTRDKDIIACGQLKQFENGFAEIGCLVVNKDFRSRGRGDAMLGYLERLCLLNNCTNIFVLSTQTMEWFVERGFDEADVTQLPPSRQATYNHKRASKIYIKKVESDRDLDASELWWNR